MKKITKPAIINAATDNVTSAAIYLLQLLKIKVTAASVEDTLQSHPYYPSLLSISDSLNRWNINTAALKTTIEKLHEMPAPFIAHLKTSGGKFITVKEIKDNKVFYLGDDNKEQYFTQEKFLAQWNEIILLAEANEYSGDANYTKAKQKEWWGSRRVPIAVMILILLGIAKAASVIPLQPALALYYTAMLFFSALGLIIGGLLLWYEYDEHNPLLQKVCSVGKKTNCHAILSSNAAKAVGNITWSEIGFTYFAGSYFYLLITGISFLPFITALNLVALPYIIFSIYYQARVAKQWCVLCLTVQGLLLLEFLAALFTHKIAIQQFNQLTIQPFNSIFFAALSFFIPAFIWFFSKPYLYAAKQGKQLRYQLARFKSNEDVFASMLQHQPAITESPEGLGITIGNPDAANMLIKVCNPYCGPCAKAHPKIEALIENNKNWKVQIIFTATGIDGDERNLPAAHLLAIAERNEKNEGNEGNEGNEKNESNEENERIKKQALDDWYNAPKKDYNVFAAKYPMNGELQLQKEKLEAMNKWCNETGITHTPTFFVTISSPLNGEGLGVRRLPEQYSIEDLQYL